ncbi:MAG TPA: YcnI family protein [Ramlibacter sp.]|nr:YcnI family protein [Ramlibacter sp.]
MKTKTQAVLIAAWTALLSTTAMAHTTLERPQAPSGSYYKAVLQVSHGCKASPTVALRVRVPEGVTSAKPQPKPGWKLAVKRTKLTKPVDAGHGRMIEEVVSEVAWTGGTLADSEFDEFRIMMKLPDQPGATLYLPVVQECREGVHRWIEIPGPGRAARDLKEPAPALLLTPRQ